MEGCPVGFLDMGCCSPMVRQPLSADQAGQLATAFKALGDPVRLRLLSLIASHEAGEACVCDLTGAFDVSQPTISHHLKVLREAGLLTSQRRATWVYYRVRPAALELLAQLLAAPAPAPGELVEAAG
jgi:ArsR family transcriptional regulator, arsenate/arsenite/antimonite-responsive transcriptional repressor